MPKCFFYDYIPVHGSEKSDGAERNMLCAIRLVLPGRMAERTLVWDVFEYVFEADRRRMGRIKPVRTYRNPIFLAREWAEALEAGNFRSKRAFARAIGLSHARVSQVLGLLRLGPDVREALDALGDPLYSRTITERKLRPLVCLSTQSQQKKVREMVN